MKIISSLLVVLMACLQSHAQNMEYGFQTGVNINTVYGNAINNDFKSSLAGFSIGGHIKFNISRHFGIKAQPQYDQNGWAYRNLYFETNNGTAIGKGDALNRLSYLNLPLLAEYTIGNKIKFNIAAGGFIGVLLKGQLITRITDPVPPNETSTTKSKSDSKKSTNAGLSFSAGIQVPLGKKATIRIQLLDNYGLSNINKSTTFSTGTLKTNALGILAGISLPLCRGKK